MKFTRVLTIGLCLGLCLVLLGLMCGCTGKQKQKRAVELYNLHYAPPEPVTQSPQPAIISIERFNAVPPYNSTRIIYSKTDFMQNKYYYHQWMINPDEMLTHLMARDLRESNIARAILVSGNSFATHQLDGTIDEFFEQDHENQWNAVLSITITLTKKNESDVTKRICYQKNYKALSPCEQKNPNGLARAMSMAMANISDMIIADIFTALQ